MATKSNECDDMLIAGFFTEELVREAGVTGSMRWASGTIIKYFWQPGDRSPKTFGVLKQRATKESLARMPGVGRKKLNDLLEVFKYKGIEIRNK